MNLNKCKDTDKIHLIIIGQFGHYFLEDFFNDYPNINCVSIGWDKKSSYNIHIKNNKIIDFDFSNIEIENHTVTDKSFLFPQNILDIFSTDKKYILLTDFFKENVIFSKEIIYWLNNKTVDFQFIGITPLVHKSLTKWAKSIFSEFDDDPRINIYDINEYLYKLSQKEKNILLSKAIEKFNNKLYKTLEKLMQM